MEAWLTVFGMQRQRGLRATLSVLLLLILPGCFGPSWVSPSGKFADTVISPNYKFMRGQRVAVIPFLNGSQQYDLATTDIVSNKLMGMGYTLVDRSQLVAIFQELKLNLVGAISPQDMKQLGRLLSVDYIVSGSEDWSYSAPSAFVYGGIGMANGASSNMEAIGIRIIDVETGQVMLSSVCCKNANILTKDFPEEIALSIQRITSNKVESAQGPHDPK